MRKREIVQMARFENYRPVSYDFRIGTIVCPGGNVADEYKIPPQGIVEVVSLENIKMPKDVFGNALVKTSLSDKGLLALGIGVIDPLYKGKLSSFIVNFSKDERLLKVGDAFLRGVFYTIPESSLANEFGLSDEEYLARSRQRVMSDFSDKFLNIEEINKKFVEEAMDKYKKTFAIWVSGAALVLALLTFFLNFGSFASMQRMIDPRISNTDAEAIIKRLDDLEEKM